jgi:hypothetical protein
MRSCSGAGIVCITLAVRHEQHLAQIVIHVEVVVHELVVLRGVEHLEERRRGIAPEVGGSLSISSSMKTGFWCRPSSSS